MDDQERTIRESEIRWWEKNAEKQNDTIDALNSELIAWRRFVSWIHARTTVGLAAHRLDMPLASSCISALRGQWADVPQIEEPLFEKEATTGG
jgi:hypothetical protein